MIDAGATTINVPDTVGYSIPSAWRENHPRLIEPGPETATRRSGPATATTTWAWRWPTRWPPWGGAVRWNAPSSGLGERAGNASLEEVVMAVKPPVICSMSIPASRPSISCRLALVSQITGYPVQPNKAIVGATPSRTSPGIHRDGVLKHRETYEIARRRGRGLEQNGPWAAVRTCGVPCPPGRDWALNYLAKEPSTPPLPASRTWPTANTDLRRTCTPLLCPTATPYSGDG